MTAGYWRAGLLEVPSFYIDEEELAAWDVTAGDGIEEEPMAVRAKFMCNSVRKFRESGNDRFLYEADFTPVSSGSDENKSFFAYTPAGSIKLSTVTVDMFEPGQAYYIDFTPAAE